MPENPQAMSEKRGKLTANKARERITSLEESIAIRQSRLDQLKIRIERTDLPDERWVNAKTRLERRLSLEREQVEKLMNLLGHQVRPPEESGEFFASEELEDLHRSQEEMRQSLALLQGRVEASESSRDLSSRLSSFEERVLKREEVDSELYSQLLTIQATSDQERQALRRLHRRVRNQDENIEALREAVEDSVVATVDLAQRLEELEDVIGEGIDTKEGGPLNRLRSELDAALKQLTQLETQWASSLALAAEERNYIRNEQQQINLKIVETQGLIPCQDLYSKPSPSCESLSMATDYPPLPRKNNSTSTLEDCSHCHHAFDSLSDRSLTELTVSPSPGIKPAAFSFHRPTHRQLAVFQVGLIPPRP